MHAPLALDYAICDFSIWNKARNTRMKFGTRTRNSFRLKNGMNSFSNDLYENEMLFGYHVNKYSRLPIIRTFKGNRKKFELSGV